MRRAFTLGIGLASIFALLSGCGGDDGESDSRPVTPEGTATEQAEVECAEAVEAGRGTCVDDGITYRIARQGEPVKLRELEAAVLDVSPRERGQVLQVTVELRVSNETNRPYEFNTCETQVGLFAGSAQYSQAESGGEGFRSDIQPGLSDMGTVAFELPASAGSEFASGDATLTVLNFTEDGCVPAGSDEELRADPTEAGYIVLEPLPDS